MKAAAIMFAAVSLAPVGCTTKPTVHAWEYKTIRGRFDSKGTTLTPLEPQINEAAGQGWEVVAASSDEGIPLVILRRPK